jgi:O-antigen/teichoic acid export membrane protein
MIVFVASLQGWVMGAIHQEKIAAKLAFYSTLLNILVNLCLIPFFHERGVAISSLICVAINFILFRAQLKKYMKTETNVMLYIKIGMAALIMGGVVYQLRNMNIIIPVVTGAVVYSGLIIALKIVKNDELMQLQKMFFKRA